MARTLACLTNVLFFVMSAAALATRPPLNRIEYVLFEDERLWPFVENAETYRLQVVLGFIEEGPNGPRLVQDTFRVDKDGVGAEYFYPASTIKFFGAVAALEHLAELRSQGVEVDENSPLSYYPRSEDAGADNGTVEKEDPSNLEDGRITVAHEIRKLFLVSDNQAYNRLYDFVGQDALNRSAHRAGISSAYLVHRLAIGGTPEENRHMPRIRIGGHEIPERHNPPQPQPASVPGLQVGQGSMAWDVEGGRRIDKPFDMSVKNRIGLADLQKALALVVRPDVKVPGGHGFRLNEADRRLLMAAMEPLPRESKNPIYDAATYTDDYVKYFLPGLLRLVPRERLRIYNKVGLAYGFSTENAYIVDVETGNAFFLAATIYTNEDGILNDDVYEYDTVALPFFADLGEAVARSVLGWGSP